MISFDSGVDLLQDFTDDPEKLANKSFDRFVPAAALRSMTPSISP